MADDKSMRERLGIKEYESVTRSILRTLCMLLDRIEKLEGKKS